MTLFLTFVVLTLIMYTHNSVRLAHRTMGISYSYRTYFFGFAGSMWGTILCVYGVYRLALANDKDFDKMVGLSDFNIGDE